VGPLCGAGPVVCCYPTGTWYAPVTPGDAAEIVERDLGRGEVVHDLAAARLEGAA
jgi:(2Fe-2S) ferredoxin